MLAALAAVVAGARYVRAAGVSVPSMVLQTSTFVNTLEVRGEIRPLLLIVLTAPSSGSDLQIVNLVRNGATSGRARWLWNSIPRPSSARSNSDARSGSRRSRKWRRWSRSRAGGCRPPRRRSLSCNRSRNRARLDLGRIELSSKVEGDKLRLAVSDAEARVRAQQRKLEGERRATAADVAIVRQKRDKAAFDVATRIGSSRRCR